MPYIKPELRAELDPLLGEIFGVVMGLARQEVGAKRQAEGYATEPSKAEVLMAAAGLFNYAITSLAVDLVGAPSYAKCSLIRGVMSDASAEFYRRVVAPYEDQKCVENGDVYD